MGNGAFLSIPRLPFDDMTIARRTCCLVVLLLASLGRAQSPVTQTSDVIVERTPPDVKTRTFDPRNPPPDMPPLRDGEAAVTESNFSCQTVIAATIIDQQRSSQGCTATVRVTSVKTTITLGITIWLPERGNKKLTAHEDGHRIIDERFYADAEAVARRLSTDMLGQRRAGKGSDCDSAAQTAIREAGDQLCGDYMVAVQRPASRVQELYDEITDHGRNRIREAAAIQQAMEQQRKEAAEGGSATKPAPTIGASQPRVATPRGRAAAKGD
jgi:hypothetical protein